MADGECVVLSGDARESQHSECKNRVQLSGSGREVGLSVRCACADQSARVLRTQNLDLDERNFSRPCFKVVVGAAGASASAASANNNHCHCPVLVSSPSSLPLPASGVSTATATAEKNEMTRRQSCRNTTKWIAAENGRKMRRTSSFDSCESSDSGVAALSSTDSSQSSATSDITEPCSPPSPVTPPRAGTPLPPSLPLHHHHGFHHHHHHHHHQMYDTRRGHSPPGSLSPPPSSVESSIAPSPPQTLEPDQEAECLLPPPAPFSVDPPATALRLEILHSMDTTSTSSSTARSILGGVGDNVSVLVCDGVSGCGKVVPVAEEVPNKCDGGGSVVVEEVLKVVEEHLLLPPPPPPPPKPPLNGPCTRAPKRKAAGGGCSAAANPSSCSSSSSSSSSSLCRWSNCRAWAPFSGDLMEHLRTYHVEQQSGSERFVCLWEGCKVYNRASCSLSWLERHVLTHGGNKPFKCIVDGCGLRFTTQSGLERHVNGHFNNQHQPTANGSLQRRKEDTPTKMLKKKRLRCFRRRCWTARTEDFFDSGVMECVQHHLVTLNTSTELDMNGTGNAVTFHGSVIARRVESTGKVKVLLHWTPEDVIPDEWVCESQALSHNKQIIRVSNLPEGALGTLQRWTSSKSCERRRSRRK